MRYTYWVDDVGSIVLCRRQGGKPTEYAASKGKFDWRQDASDPDVLEFTSEDAARREASERGINPAEVR